MEQTQKGKKFPRSGKNISTFVKYFPCLHNGFHAYNDIYIPIESVLMGDSEFSHGCQKFLNLEKIPTLWAKNFQICKIFSMLT
jgi:hypothetical protein